MLLRLVVYTNFLIGFLVSKSHQDQPRNEKQPNIVLILADDFGYNDVGYHNPYVLTPNLDELANTGLILEQSYVQPLCTPTRSALMTGVYPYLIGRQGKPLISTWPTGLTLDRKLLPEYLKEKGYATHSIGKWHLGFCKEEYLPTNRGFDSHLGYWSAFQNYYYHTDVVYDAYDFHDNEDTFVSANNTFSEDLFADRFTMILDDHVSNKPETPLFVYMAHQATHSPLDPPQEFLDLYPDVQDDERKRFFGTASAMDAKIGKMVTELKEQELYDNTILIFLGDNGANTRAGGNNWPLRGEKSEVYEGGVRTPGFVHSPLLSKSGQISEKLTHVTDWLPTLYHVAGATDQEISEQNFSGINQWSTIQDPDLQDVRTEMVVNLDDFDGVTVGALRQDNFKLVKHLGRYEVGWYEPPEWNNMFNTNDSEDEIYKEKYFVHLFNLDNDFDERVNLIDELPEIYNQMSLRMEELKDDLVPRDEPPPVEGCIVDGFWISGWC